MPSSLLVLLVMGATAPTPPANPSHTPATPPINPEEPDLLGPDGHVVKPTLTAGKPTPSPGVEPDAGTPTPSADPVPEKEAKTTPSPADRQPVSENSAPVGASTLCDELRIAAELKKASKSRAEADRKAIAAERARLLELQKEIAAAREQLRSETARLERLVAQAGTRGGTPTPPPTTGREDVGALARSLKAMKPVQAAAVLSKLDPGLAARVLQRMSPKDSGAVLQLVKPELAAELMTSISALPPTTTGRRPP